MTIKVTYNVTDVYMSQSVSPVYINVSYSDGGASGGGVWGSITGTLSNQTDLQTALDLKVPYSGATGNVNLGEYELKAGQVTLDTSPTGTAAVGTIRWNDTTGTSETTLKGGNVIIKNGVDLVARVVNKVTPNTTLTKAAYQAVRVSGAQGQRLAIELAQANNDAGSADTIGLVTETIAPNQEGFIMTVGQLEGINTTGSLQGETWVDGDVLYLSPTTAGAITNVKPTAVTGHIVVIGYVEYSHVNNGKIYVKVMNGWELDELHNVSIVTPTNNQGLFYNSSNSLWENKTIDTALGFTPVPTTRNITINGVTYDLSADRTWTIAAGISGSGTAGQVTYWTGSSAVSGSNNLFWDNANGRLGIGTNAPAVKLDVNGQIITTGTSGKVGAIGANTYGISVQNNASASWIEILNNGGAGKGVFFGLTNDRTTNAFELWNYQAGPIDFYTGGTASTGTIRARIGNNGNISIGTSSDLGVRLGVVGDSILRGSGSTIATTALTVQNSSSTNLLRVLNDGDVSFGADAMYWDAVTSRLGIGTNAPAAPIQIGTTSTSPFGSPLLFMGRDQNAESNFQISNSTNGTSASVGFRLFGANGRSTIIAEYSGSFTNTELAGHLTIIPNSPGSGNKHGLIFAVTDVNSGSDIMFYTQGLTSANKKAQIYNATGNLVLQNGGTFSDGGQRLQVYGDTLLRGSGATSATTALTVQNSSSTNLLTVRNDNRVTIRNSWIEPYTSSSANDAIKLVSNNLGASIGVQNENATGFSGIEYLNNSGAVRVFTGFNNNNGTEFRFNNIATNGYTTFMIGSTSVMTIKTNRQIRFHPLSSAPASPEAGDVYYDSTLNKLRVYTTAWETITSI